MATTTPDPGTLFQFEIPFTDTPALSQEIRDNFRALACTNYTTDPGFPQNPQPGMMRVLASNPNNVMLQVFLIVGGSGVWETIIQNIQLGFAAVNKNIVVFNAPGLNPWVVNHNLNSFPLVQVLDSSGFQLQVIPTGGPIGAGQYTLQHATPNRFIVTFSGVQAGFAVYAG